VGEGTVSATVVRWIGVAVCLTTSVVMVVAAVRDPTNGLPMLPMIGYLVVGALLVWRRPDNRIGWWLIAVGVGFMAGGLYAGLDESAFASWPPLVVALARPIQPLGWLALVTLVALFPSGVATTTGQRWVVRLIAVVTVVVVVAMATDLGAVGGGRPNPLGIPAVASFTAFLASSGFAVVPLLLVASLLSLAPRWRASVGIERLQFRWLGWALGVCLLGVLVLFFGQFDEPYLFIGVFALNAIPVAVWVAVTRYELFDIDRVVSRTTAYVIVTGVLLSAVVGSGSTFAVAAATLTAAALARPVLRRVQSTVDRRFNRSRYDATTAVDAFGARLRDEVDPHLVADDLIAVVTRTLQPDQSAVWVRPPA
jgi:hypothetical protein